MKTLSTTAESGHRIGRHIAIGYLTSDAVIRGWHYGTP
jgi:hypothetical protein